MKVFVVSIGMLPQGSFGSTPVTTTQTLEVAAVSFSEAVRQAEAYARVKLSGHLNNLSLYLVGESD